MFFFNEVDKIVDEFCILITADLRVLGIVEESAEVLLFVSGLHQVLAGILMECGH